MSWSEYWDDVVDVLVVGSGATASAAAAWAAAEGSSVLVVEKGGFTGGTTGKSGGVMWVPDNPVGRRTGLVVDRDETLRYMARTGHPIRFVSGHPTLGLDPLTHRSLEVFFDHGHDVLSRLEALGAFELEAVDYPDYYAEADAEPTTGHVIQARFPDGWRKGIDPTGGQLLTDALLRVAVEHGAEVRVGHEVAELVVDADGEVIGAEVRVGRRTELVGVRKGVIFGSGGFLHDRDLARTHLRGPVFGGGAVDTATGDLVRIGARLGARFGNMTHAWWDQVAVEHAVTVPSTMRDVYSPFGDSMLMVNKYGRRAVNEKAVYNERSQAHFTWDPSRWEYPNLLLFMVFDQAVVDDPNPSRFRWPIPLPGEPFPPCVITAPTLPLLTDELRPRVAALAEHTGGLQLDPGFADELTRSIERFNELADAGVDTDFRRGSSQIERTWAGPARPGAASAVMHRLRDTGPYHCVILGAGALDTKGGPVTDEHARIVRSDGTPIGGLYGAGNCVASPAGQAYWGPGGTIGPAVVFGAIAAAHSTARSPRSGTEAV